MYKFFLCVCQTPPAYIYDHRIRLIYEYWYYVIREKAQGLSPSGEEAVSLTVRSPSMEVRVGTRVVRGPHWTWRDQDGGEGHVGSVAEVQLQEPAQGEEGRTHTSDLRGPRACAVTVQWDCGNRCRYRCGLGGKYDLRVFDSGPAGWSQQGRGRGGGCNFEDWREIILFFSICTFCFTIGHWC